MERGCRRAWRVALLVLAAALCGGGPLAAAAAAATTGAPAGTAPPGKPIDINSASVAELKTLPGIGEAEAARIVAARPYRSKAMLVEAGALSEAQFDAVKRRVVAIQKPPAPAAKATAKP